MTSDGLKKESDVPRSESITSYTGKKLDLIIMAMLALALGYLAFEKFEHDAAYNIAYVLAFRDESDRAFEWLDKAVEYGDPGLMEIQVENLFSNLYDDPRWLLFLERIGKSPAQLAAIKFKVVLPE